MKNKLYIALVSLGAIATINAATININNVNNLNDSNGIVDNAGNVIAAGSGVIAVGHFTGISTANVSSTSLTDLQSSFDAYGNTVSFGAFGFDELFSGVVNGPTLDTDPAANQGLFLVVGNASTVAASDQLLIWSPGISFPSGEIFSATVSIQDGQGTLIAGEFNNFSADFGEGAVSAFNLVAVPEPSSAALLGLGAMALVFRRRK